MTEDFVNTLSEYQLDLLSTAIYNRRHELYRKRIANGEFEPVTQFERDTVVTKGKIAVIKLYRDRVRCSLAFAKYVIEWSTRPNQGVDPETLPEWF